MVSKVLNHHENFINHALQMDDLKWQLIQLNEQVETKQITNGDLIEITKRLAKVSMNLISCYQKMDDYKESSWKDNTPVSLSVEVVEINLKGIANVLDGYLQ